MNLKKLCDYYLECLSKDDTAGVSVFARSRYDEYDYLELSYLPVVTDQNLQDNDNVNRFFRDIQADRRSKKELFLGYPVYLRKHITANEVYYFVEPIFLFSFERQENQSIPLLEESLPQLNFKAIASITRTSGQELLSFIIQLSEQLHLDVLYENAPEIEDVLYNFYQEYSDWDWKEPFDFNNIELFPPIRQLEIPGIYNRAVVVATERSPYTIGLETELYKLSSLKNDEIRGTVLEKFLNNSFTTQNQTNQTPLIEILPLNQEQREAVQSALCNPITVITGPPGTGKSQIVSSILINATWQEKKVLFASKNNKAVDVVEERVNSLGIRPVVLRLGSRDFRRELAYYLENLLAATTTNTDIERYNEFQNLHKSFVNDLEKLYKKLDDVVQLRNDTDELERIIENYRNELNANIFHNIRNLNISKLKESLKKSLHYCERAIYSCQNKLIQLIWFAIKEKRLQEFNLQFNQFIQQFPFLVSLIDQTDLDKIKESLENLQDKKNQFEQIQKYLNNLDKLSNQASLEEIEHSITNKYNQYVQNSANLWEYWLRIQPSKYNQSQRNLISEYATLLNLIVQSDLDGTRINRNTYRRYYELFPQVSSILPCWAITSLSARGSLPLEPNFFDILVIDEASQCDIASALPLFYRAKNVVIIGDSMQLKHISQISKEQDLQLFQQNELNNYNWLYSQNSLFDLAKSVCNPSEMFVLKDHHRSHLQIIDFSNKMFYNGDLRIVTNYQRLKFIDNSGIYVRWINVAGKVERTRDGSYVNETEAKEVVEQVRRLKDRGYQGTIGIVTIFRSQANRINELINELGINWGDSVLCDTVWRFQGDERDVMFFSPVLSNGATSTSISFIKNNINLFNVAITRARATLITVGNQNWALECDIDHYKKFANYCLQINVAPPKIVQEQLNDLGDEYPQVARPELVSDWEKFFYRVLRQHNIKPLVQYPEDKYLLDFAIICGDRKLNIEIDGEYYHRRWDGELCRRDHLRNQRLFELGWDVMRFWVYQIRDDTDKCVSKIKSWVDKNCNH